MTLKEAINQPNFEFDHASIDITVPVGNNMVEDRCYFTEDASKLDEMVNDLLNTVDVVIIGVFGKLNGQNVTYICGERRNRG